MSYSILHAPGMVGLGRFGRLPFSVSGGGDD